MDPVATTRSPSLSSPNAPLASAAARPLSSPLILRPPASSGRLQPNVDTRQKQLAAWCSLVLSFCRLHKQSSMTVMEAQESPLFNNVKLQRILPRALPQPTHMHFYLSHMPRLHTPSHSQKTGSHLDRPWERALLCS